MPRQFIGIALELVCMFSSRNENPNTPIAFGIGGDLLDDQVVGLALNRRRRRPSRTPGAQVFLWACLCRSP